LSAIVQFSTSSASDAVSVVPSSTSATAATAATPIALTVVERSADDDDRRQHTTANAGLPKAAPIMPMLRESAVVDVAWGSTVPRNLLHRM
jgi:hypothetical protein